MIVNVKVVEGERSRVQAYEGVCIARTGGGINESFTVRKISYGEGVERVFPLYSPLVNSIKVVRRGKVRRAKLYYLRGLRGKRPASPRSRITPRRRSNASPGEDGRVVQRTRRSRSQILAEAVRPDTTALIVYDMQVGILRQLQRGRRCWGACSSCSAGARCRRARSSSCATCRCRRSSIGVFQMRQAMALAAQDRRPTT